MGVVMGAVGANGLQCVVFMLACTHLSKTLAPTFVANFTSTQPVRSRTKKYNCGAGEVLNCCLCPA